MTSNPIARVPSNSTRKSTGGARGIADRPKVSLHLPTYLVKGSVDFMPQGVFSSFTPHANHSSCILRGENARVNVVKAEMELI